MRKPPQDFAPAPAAWLWPREVAALFGVSTYTVTRWADDGLIPVHRLPSGHRRYRQQDIDSLLNPAPSDLDETAS